ncbi:MAG: hypothetical protein P8Y70_12960 [Candidatus Lokiarchaeota archaeon]
MSTTKIKTSNTLLNLLLIVMGCLFIFRAILDFLSLTGLAGIVPQLLSDLTSELGSSAAFTVLGSQGLISIVLGFWSIVAGIGMFKEEKWAMGQALVILSIMVVSVIFSIIDWIINPLSFKIDFYPNYITLAIFIVGVIGFIWLLITRKRYY